MSILTDRVIFSGSPAGNDLIHIVDVSDATDNPAGTSFAIEVSGLTSPFTGNTSGDCITDLYLTNLYGCSPLHIEPSGLNNVYMVENGGNVAIGHDTPTELLHVSGGDILVEGSNGKIYTDLSSSDFRLSAGTSALSTIGITTPSSGGLAIGTRGSSTASFTGYGEQGDGFLYSSANQHGLNIISQDGSGTDYIRFYAGKDCLSTSDMFILGTVVNSGYIGMGTETPTEKLHVVGSIKMVDGNQSNGYVLTSDANGVGSWQVPTFTGNTSGDCITDLYITNLYGCSPITINDNLQHISSSATGINSTAWGTGTTASGDYSHAEGSSTSATTNSSHAEGYGTLASGKQSHAEGGYTIASGDYGSHAEGNYTIASGDYGSHAEGSYTTASGFGSHAEGKNTIASGDHSHSGGRGKNLTNRIIASGETSFVHFRQTSASGIIGSYGDYSAILGGNDHNIGTGSTSSGIFAGSGNTINDDVLRSVVIGGNNIIGTTDDTVYVPNLNINNLIMANDDTDAGLSGLTTGDIYQTSGNGGAPLNEIGLLMIKQ